NLESLSLDPNFSPSFTGNDFVHLEPLSNLRELSLSNMVLPYDDGLSHLKGLKLKTLTLFDCWIAAPDLEKLQADLPKTKIIRKFSLDENAKNWHMYAAKRKKPAKK